MSIFMQQRILQVAISEDGLDMEPAILQPNIFEQYYYHPDGRVKSVKTKQGDIAFLYSPLNGRIYRIGLANITYGWFGSRGTITHVGQDDRIEIIIVPMHFKTENRK